MKPIKVKVGKKIYLMKYTINAFCELEEVTEHANINELFAAVQSGSFQAIRAMVWAGLIWNDEDLTLKDVGDLIGDIEGLGKFSKAIEKAFIASAPVVKQNDEGDDGPDPTK